ncbi:MAG: DNA repair protein RadA [Candidatus Daviesbacteria bacterium]|nr:DNA repair protein RadA [Candidatus Daviesbacteria bacterium]
MPKVSSVYVCQQCGFQVSQFLGKCPSCESWGSLVETLGVSGTRHKAQSSKLGTKLPEVIELSKIEKTDYQRLSSGLPEFDRVLGGGIVLGSLILVSGDPGIGKSTLLTQLALNIQNLRANSCLYVAGEESAHQIKIRVDRLRVGASLQVLNEVDVDLIMGVIDKLKPTLVIVDSIQTLETEDLQSAPGSVGQVRECAHRLQHLAKKLHIPIVLVGHVTKDGTVAGPKTLEHLVDLVLSLEGDPTNNFRILRSSKNRFGPTDEVGIFEMAGGGMIEVKNPSKLFLEQRVEAPGSAIVSTLTGLRPLLVEVQALVTKSFLPMPKRAGSGVDNNRLQLLVAVLTKRLGLSLFDQDIFVNVTGGLKLTEPAADLGICMAIISSFKDKPLKQKTVFVGEVGLLGELRSVREISKRSAEAKKLGFNQVISPENAKSLSEASRLAIQ